MNYQKHKQYFTNPDQVRRYAPINERVRPTSYMPRRPVVVQKPPRRINMSKLVPGVAMIVVLIGGYMLFGRDQPSVVAPQEQEQAAVVVPETPSLDYAPISTTINAVIAEYPGMDIGVSAIDIKTGDVQSYGVQVPFVAASTAKLLTAIAYLHDVEQGKLTLTQQVGGRSAQQALEALIVKSDNQAWDDLNNVVMSHAELAEYANMIGFTGYNPDANTVIPSSLATLLSNLYQRRLINDSHTDLLLSYMQRAQELDYITSIVPAGVKAYHKPGYLKDRVHDALILDDGSRPYILVVFTKSRTAFYDSQAGQDVFKRVGRATFQTFMRVQ